MSERKKEIGLICGFVLIVYAISAIGYYFWFNYSEVAAFITILAPLVGYFIVSAHINKSDRIHFRFFSWKEMGIGSLIPFSYIIPAICFSVVLSKNCIEYNSISIGFVIGLILKWAFAGICEEIGWRGFLLPSLSKIMGRTPACILCGLIWGVWHIPLIARGDIIVQYPMIISVVVFIIETIAITFIMDSMEGKSVWRFAAFHAVHNILIQLSVEILENDSKSLFDDGGATLVILIVIIATIMFIRNKRNSSRG